MRFLIIAILLTMTTMVLRAADNSSVAEVTIPITTQLHGQHCVDRIKGGLKFVKGMKSIKVNLKDNAVTVRFDKTKTSVDDIRTELAKLGYTTQTHDCCTNSDKKAEPSHCHTH